MNMSNNNITEEELASFLEGTLPEQREKEVADAIDNSKELQSVVEAILDIEDLMMFEEFRRAKKNTRPTTVQTGPDTTQHQIKTLGKIQWGKVLSSEKASPKTASSWDEDEYRKAADNEETRQIQLKPQKRVKKNIEVDGHSFWLEVIVGIIVLIIFTLIRSC